MDKPIRSGCPINLTLETLGDRWSVIVIRDVMFGNRRHPCGRRFTPATPQLSIRAQLLEGGPEMWEAFMAELRSLHLGTKRPERSVIRELTDAYLAATG